MRLLRLCTLLFLLSPFVAYGQTDSTATAETAEAEETAVDNTPEKFFSATDTSSFQERPFSESTLRELKNDSDLRYKQPPTVAISIWDRFLEWLSEFFRDLIRGTTETSIGNSIIYIIAGAIFIYIILALLKVDAFRMLKGRGASRLSHTVLEENIHEMEFDKLIAEAKQRGDLRIATRLVFLYALKLLSDKNLINWVPGKTNLEYQHELSEATLRPGFDNLSTYFDYAWYGNFPITPETFRQIESTFDQWRSKVGS